MLAEGGLGIHGLAERVDVEISRNAGFGEDEGGVGDLVVPIACPVFTALLSPLR